LCVLGLREALNGEIGLMVKAILNKRDLADVARLEAKPSLSADDLRKVMDLGCKRCTYNPFENIDWRVQIGNCADSTCPVHPFRTRGK